MVLDGKTFIIGMKGIVFDVKECPTHLTTLEIGGNT